MSSSAGPPPALPPRAGRKYPRWILVLPLAALVALAGVLVYVDFFGSSTPAPVQVSNFSWHFTACYGAPQTSSGISTQRNTPFEANLLVTFTGVGDCHLASVSILTPGFVLLGATVPIDITGSTSGWLSVGIQSPDQAFSGPVNIEVNSTATG